MFSGLKLHNVKFRDLFGTNLVAINSSTLGKIVTLIKLFIFFIIYEENVTHIQCEIESMATLH